MFHVVWWVGLGLGMAGWGRAGWAGPVGVEPDEVGPFFKLFFRNFFVRLFLGVGGGRSFFFDFGLFCELHGIDSSLAGIRHSRMSVL